VLEFSLVRARRSTATAPDGAGGYS
jgi:hypothetical protein